MPPGRELVIVLLGLVLFVLVSHLTGRAARRHQQRDLFGYMVQARYGWRASMDTLQLAMVWLIIKQPLEVPASLVVAGTSLPMAYVYIFSFALFMFADFRIRELLNWS